MPEDLDERDILRLTRLVSREQPSLETAQQAIAAARRGIEQHQIIQRHHRRRRWIIMTSSGIAATVLLSLALLFVSAPPQSASAAERLEEAAEAGDAYRGWVHMKASMPDIPDAPKESVVHSNTEDGTYITDQTFPNGRRQVSLLRPSTREEITYDSEKKEIRIGTLYEEFAKNWQTQIRNSPYTLRGMLESIKRSGDGEATVTVAKPEGGLDRFDVKLPKQKPSPDRVMGSEDVSVWIDPKTKLVQKMSSKIQDKPVEMNFTYGKPEIREIYDLGVPSDAKVVDNRTKQDVDAIFKRLEERVSKGFGTHVAVETQYSPDEQGKPEKAGQLTLMAMSDDGDALGNQYLIGKGIGNPNQPLRVDVEGWPTPALPAVLTLKDASPSTFMIVIDRKSGWQGFSTKPGEYHVNALTGKYTQMIPMLFAQFTAPGKIWPTRTGLGLFGAGAKASIEPVKDHPEWVGLKIEQATWTGKGPKDSPGSTQRSERHYVINPKRDDMTVSMTYTSYPPGGDKPESEFTTTYTEHAQLPGGAWYPKSWTTKSLVRQTDGKEVRYEQITTLQIFPGEKLDDTWFRNYAEKKAK
jgi:hypothetical protein